MKFLQYTKHDEIGILEFNRPDSLNALNHELLHETLQFVNDVKDIKVMILTGSGGKAFAAGADVKEMLNMNHHEAEQYFALGQNVASSFRRAPYIVIAALQGYALGGGLEMALGCDFIYASKNAKIGFPEVTLGLIPGFGGIKRLYHAAGIRRAKELIMTGKHITAQQAYEWGIVNRVCENLIEECMATAKTICENEFGAVIRAKEALQEAYGLSCQDAFDNERELCADCHSTEEAQARMKRFAKR